MHVIRKADVLLYGEKIGELSQDGEIFRFAYLPDYQGVPLSLSLPVKQREFVTQQFFPYFASLVPEGWLKAKYADLQKIDNRDLFSLLLNNGDNLIGAVQIVGRKT
ncbi:HipA N-terminal domain-containing protein [Mannheimia sp. AT1]|uniref:HipA N-terminal domain-containing protein n=1 Tax=Mannheimia cairinae TaxID=3025936 RepID=A0ABT5MPW4_9PAST|nr:HipA N-terminal domain-containing protein [Mannheimia cairinae]MDD0824217.1 HipA N-terminal domain-containing protein [Mannheimia cairinae]MDD0826660.1 HipA N-terminal domain-containing protein [Mannheimia cairinae]